MMDQRKLSVFGSKLLLRFAILPVLLISPMPRCYGAQRQPNVILILADDVSAREYSMYGGADVKTPHLDALATSGICFRTVWAAPVCGPSRAMLMTGRYNETTGLGPNAAARASLKRMLDNPQIGRLMRKAGYATGIFGKLHHGGDPKDYGFDEHCLCLPWAGYTGKPQNKAAKGGMYAVHWYWHPGLIANGKGVPSTANDFGPEIECERILDFISRKKNGPFFVFWPTNLPHHEFVEKTGRWARPDVPELDTKGKPTGNRIAGSLESNLAYLDAKMGQIHRHLKDLGIAGNTIFIYTADNGTAGYGKGIPDSSKAVRVPLIVGGGHVPPLGARDEMIDFTDILPTLLDLAGATAPKGLDGRSFAPLLNGRPFAGREWIYSSGELQRRLQGTIGRWVRDERWLLDASDQLWDCGKERDEKHYRRVSPDAPDAAATIKRLKSKAPRRR